MYSPIAIFLALLYYFRDSIARYLSNKFSRNIQVQFTKTIGVLVILLAFSVAVTIIAINYNYSDVDDHQVDAIQHLMTFRNPYGPDAETIHRHPNGTIIPGPYNYLPVDLFCYSIVYGFIGLLGLYWVFPWLQDLIPLIANFVFASIGYLLFHHSLPKIPVRVKYPVYVLLMSFFMNDNVVLMTLFIAAALLVESRKGEGLKQQGLVVFLLSLASLTKFFAVFILVGYFVFKLLPKFWKSFVILSPVPIITFLGVSFPFNPLWVLESTIFFHSDIAERGAVSIIEGGIVPVIFNLLGPTVPSILFPITALVVLAILLLIGGTVKHNWADKSIFVSLGCLLLLPNANYAFLLIPAYIFILREAFEWQERGFSSFFEKEDTYLKEESPESNTPEIQES